MKRFIFQALIPMVVLVLITLLACFLAYLLAFLLADPTLLRKLIIRLSQGFLLLSIFPVMTVLKLQRSDLGIATFVGLLKQIPLGFGLGLISLMPVFYLFYLLGINVIDYAQPWTVGWLLKKIVTSLALALLIGVVEELVFRGMLLAALRKNLPTVMAVLVSAIYFAGLHFLDSKQALDTQTFNLYGSLVLLGDAYANIFKVQNISAFCSLFMVAVFLSALRLHRPAGLGLSIGCHAGWVWQMKMSGSLFNIDYQSPYLYLVSQFNFVIGPMVTVWLMFAVLIYLAFLKYFHGKG